MYSTHEGREWMKRDKQFSSSVVPATQQTSPSTTHNFYYYWLSDLHSTQWAGAELLDYSGDAEVTQTLMSTTQSECGFFHHAHHTDIICDQKKGITVTNWHHRLCDMFHFNTNTKIREIVLKSVDSYLLFPEMRRVPCCFQWGLRHQKWNLCQCQHQVRWGVWEQGRTFLWIGPLSLSLQSNRGHRI